MDINNGSIETTRNEEMIQVKLTLQRLQKQVDRNSKMVENIDKTFTNFMNCAASIKDNLPWDLPYGNGAYVGKIRTPLPTVRPRGNATVTRPDDPILIPDEPVQNDDRDELPDLVPQPDNGDDNNDESVEIMEDAQTVDFNDDNENDLSDSDLDGPPPPYDTDNVPPPDVYDYDTMPPPARPPTPFWEKFNNLTQTMYAPKQPPTTPTLWDTFNKLSKDLRQEISDFKIQHGIEDVVRVPVRNDDASQSPSTSLFNISPMAADDDPVPKSLNEVFRPSKGHMKIWKFKDGSKFYEVPPEYIVNKK